MKKLFASDLFHDVYTALKQYHRPEDLIKHPICSWTSVQERVKSKNDVVKVVRDVLDDACDRLLRKSPQGGYIIYEQYIRKRSRPDDLANELHLDVRTYHRKRRDAIHELALTLVSIEEAVRNAQNRNPHFIDSTFNPLTIVDYLVNNDANRIQSYFGAYRGREIEAIKNALLNAGLPPSDHSQIVAQLQSLYETFSDDSFSSLAIRQNALYLIGETASLLKYDFIEHAWHHENHPWVKRAALLGNLSDERIEEYLYYLRKDDLAREVARTFPRVFYGDQSAQLGIYTDDNQPNYYNTLWYYMLNYSKYLYSSSLGMTLFVINDIIRTKGVVQILEHRELAGLIYRGVNLPPKNHIALEQWRILVKLLRPIKDRLKEP